MLAVFHRNRFIHNIYTWLNLFKTYMTIFLLHSNQVIKIENETHRGLAMTITAFNVFCVLYEKHFLHKALLCKLLGYLLYIFLTTHQLHTVTRLPSIWKIRKTEFYLLRSLNTLLGTLCPILPTLLHHHVPKPVRKARMDSCFDFG